MHTALHKSNQNWKILILLSMALLLFNKLGSLNYEIASEVVDGILLSEGQNLLDDD